MRTAAFSDLQIIAAVIELQANNRQISPYTVIKKLGGGSQPYMASALKRLARTGHIKVESIADEDDEILQQIKGLLEKNRKESRLQALKEYTKFKDQLEASNNDLRDKLKNSEATVKSLTDQLRNTSSQLNSVSLKLTESEDKAQTLALENARLTEQLTNTKESLEKSEKQSDSYITRILNAQEKFQQERLELLGKINDITISSRNNALAVQRSEQSLRKQLELAMKDGITHTTTIAKQRDDLRVLNDGKALLKKYGSWPKIAELCKQALSKGHTKN